MREQKGNGMKSPSPNLKSTVIFGIIPPVADEAKPLNTGLLALLPKIARNNFAGVDMES